MDAQQVTDKILSDARSQADKITGEAEQKRKAEMAQLDEELGRYKQQTAVKAAKAADDKKSHILAAARMQISKEYLAEKRVILDEVFEKAKQRLQSLSDEDYLGLMRNLMLKAVETGDEEVIVDEKETRINNEFINRMNNELGQDSKRNLRLSEKRQKIGAGFILSRGKIKNNATLEVLISQARSKLEAELAKELFVNIQ